MKHPVLIVDSITGTLIREATTDGEVKEDFYMRCQVEDGSTQVYCLTAVWKDTPESRKAAAEFQEMHVWLRTQISELQDRMFQENRFK